MSQQKKTTDNQIVPATKIEVQDSPSAEANPECPQVPANNTSDPGVAQNAEKSSKQQQESAIQSNQISSSSQPPQQTQKPLVINQYAPQPNVNSQTTIQETNSVQKVAETELDKTFQQQRALAQAESHRQKIENLAKLSQEVLNANQGQQFAETKTETIDQKMDKVNELKKIQLHNSHQRYEQCAMLRDHLVRQNVVQKHQETALKEVEQLLDQKQEQKKEALINGQKAAAGDRSFDNIRSVGGLPQQGLQNLKQNQNLFLSLQSKEDKLNRWKYTLLVLDNMIDQIMGRGPYRGYEQGFWGQNPHLQTTIGGSGPIRVNQNGVRIDQDDNEAEMQDGEIDFVKIAENLPKLAIFVGPKESPVSQLALGEKKQSSGRNQNPNKTLLRASDGAGKKVQRISLQPRICSKLWEALRKSLKESFKMELEFFDHTRQELTQNFHVEALLMFQRRLQVYLANHDLLTLKQAKHGNDGRKFFEEELRAQRLVETFCNMCEKAEQSGLSTRYKMTFMQIGQSLKEELKKTDNLTEQELKDIRAACNDQLGEEAHLYDDLEQILNKIYHEVSDQHKKRKQEVLGSNSTAATKWTNVEVAQLLVAVYNMGEGEWTEIQKRLNFQSSGVVKTPNQVAHRWQQIKRLMKRDMLKLRKSQAGARIVTKYEWILQTLRQMNEQDPSIDLKPEHLEVLENSVLINPNSNLTPYQQIIQKFHRDQHALHEQRVQKAAKSQLKQNQKTQIQVNLKPVTDSNDPNIQISNQQTIETDRKEKSEETKEAHVGQKQSYYQRFGGSNDIENTVSSPLHPSKMAKIKDAQIIVKNPDNAKKEQLFQSPIMDIAPGIPVPSKPGDKVDLKEDPFAPEPQSTMQNGHKISQSDPEQQPLLKLQSVTNNSVDNINNFAALSGLKDHKLKDHKKSLAQGAHFVGHQHQRDHGSSSMASALNIAKTVQQSSIHQVQPGQRDAHLAQRLKDAHQAKEDEFGNKNPKLDLNIEDATMIYKIRDEIMASVNNFKLNNAKQGVAAGGLPGNTSILNSNENSSNSAPQLSIQKSQMANNQKMVEAQHVHSFKTSQTFGADQNAADSQLNQQITINNNISITTIHNHEQGDKKNQKVYTASSVPKAGATEGSSRAPRGTMAAGASANAATGDSQHSLSGLQLQAVMNNICQGQNLPPQSMLQQAGSQSIAPSTMAKKQSIGLLINNPLNTIQAPQQARTQSQYGALPGMAKADSIHNVLRHQTIENKQSYCMSTSQINSNKRRELVGGRQPGSAQIQQNLTNIGIQKSQSLINFQLSGPGKMSRVSSQHPVAGNNVSGAPPQSMLKAESMAKLQASPLLLGAKTPQNMPLTQHSGPHQKPMHLAAGPQPNAGVPAGQKKTTTEPRRPSNTYQPGRFMSHKQYLLSKTMKKKPQPAPTAVNSAQGQPPQNQGAPQ